MTNNQLLFAIAGLFITIFSIVFGLVFGMFYKYVDTRFNAIDKRFDDLYRYLDLNIKIVLDKIEELEKKIK